MLKRERVLDQNMGKVLSPRSKFGRHNYDLIECQKVGQKSYGKGGQMTIILCKRGQILVSSVSVNLNKRGLNGRAHLPLSLRADHMGLQNRVGRSGFFLQ